MSFAGKVVLITGASSGIGAACAEYFGQQGALLALTSRNMEGLERTKEACMPAPTEEIPEPVEPLLIQADLLEDCENIMQAVIERYEKLDILINAAGVLQPGSVLETSMDNYDHNMNTNVRSVFQLSTLAIPHLVETQGNIVNISGSIGLRSTIGMVAYCMSKAAIGMFTQCAAIDLGPKKVRVNAVAPGMVATDLHKTYIPEGVSVEEVLEHYKEHHAMERLGTVDEVVHAIAFLACDDMAGFITGTVLPVDGGLNAMLLK